MRSVINVAAVALYVYLMSVDLNGRAWYLGLAVPIILWGGAVWLLLSLMLRVYHRSVISSAAILIGSLGVFLLGVSFHRPLAHRPMGPLLVPGGAHHLRVYRDPPGGDPAHPRLPEEVRRRFHT